MTNLRTKSAIPLSLLLAVVLAGAILWATNNPPPIVRAAITVNSVAAGVWTVTSDAGDAMTLGCAGGVSSTIADLNVTDLVGGDLCTSITSIVVTGGTGNTIDLSGVTAAAFTGLTAGNITVNGGTGVDTITASPIGGTYNGLAGADTITGGGGADTLAGGAGADTLAGGLGNDTYGYTAAADFTGDTITENAAEGTDTLDFSALGAGDPITATLPANVENATGGAGGDTLTGNALDNSLTGGAGSDFLDGGAGNDTLDGGLGTDNCINGETISNCEGSLLPPATPTATPTATATATPTSPAPAAPAATATPSAGAPAGLPATGSGDPLASDGSGGLPWLTAIAASIAALALTGIGAVVVARRHM